MPDQSKQIKRLEKEILARRKTEEALRKSEESYRNVVETMKEGLVVVDEKLNLTFVNDSFCRITGFTKEELLRKDVLVFLSEEYQKIVREQFRKRRKGAVDSYELAMDGKDKRKIHLLASPHPMFDEQGRFKGTVAVIADITERRQAEKALRESELKFRELAESIGDVFYALDKDLKYTYWNKPCEKMTGIPAEKAIGKSVYDLFPEARGSRTEKLYQDALEKKRPGNVEVECEIQGIKYTFDINVYPSQYGLSVYAKDVTARKRAEAAVRESEERFRTIFHSAAVAIWEEDFSGVKAEIEKLKARGVKDFRKYLEEHPEFMQKTAGLIKVLDVNNTALKLYGAKSKKELIASADKVFVPETLPAFKEVIVGLAEGREEIETETVNGTLDGRRLNVLKRTYIPTGRTKFDNLLVSAVDISDLKKAEAALRKRAEFEFLITMISTKFINLRPEEIDLGIEQALKAIGEFDGVDRCYLFLRSEDGTKVSNTHEWCADGIEPQLDRLKDLPIETFPWWADRFLNKHEAVHIPSVDALPSEAQAEKEILQSLSFKSVLAVPIIFRGSVVGFLGFVSVKTEKSWEEEKVVLLRMTGEIFINALERKRMEEELRKERDSLEVRVDQSTAALRRSEMRLQERLRELTCLYKIRDEFDREQPLEEILYSCVSHIRNALNEPEKKVVLINLDGNQIIIESCSYSNENYLESLIQIRGVKRGFLRVFTCMPEAGFLPFEWDLIKHAGASLASLIQNRELREHLIQSEKMAAAGRLAAGVAHEINNPLGSIKNSLFILKKSISAKHPDHSYLDLMDNEIDRVSGIIAQLYNLYKPSASEMKQVNLASVVGNVLKMLEPQISRRKIVVRNEMGKNSAKLKLSVNQVTQVLYNIILNAVQVMPLGGRLTIGCTKYTGRLELWVSDTGPGIRDDVLPHIFEPFFSTKTKGAHPTEGMGMGLPLSRSLMETLGGTITVKTKVGWGSTFILNFPTKPLKREKDESK
ncbi:MAG: PAS domain S-box protein [Deltaproteobacteria bacterium]|nr:PAS domain S-box protein [Deltaproteobacteria bacterium]